MLSTSRSIVGGCQRELSVRVNAQEWCGGIHLRVRGAIAAGKENYFQCLCSSTAAGAVLGFTNVSLSYSGL